MTDSISKMTSELINSRIDAQLLSEAVINKDLVTTDNIVVESCANAKEELNRLQEWAQKLSGVVQEKEVVSELTKMSDMLRQSSKDLNDLLIGGAASA